MMPQETRATILEVHHAFFLGFLEFGSFFKTFTPAELIWRREKKLLPGMINSLLWSRYTTRESLRKQTNFFGRLGVKERPSFRNHFSRKKVYTLIVARVLSCCLCRADCPVLQLAVLCACWLARCHVLIGSTPPGVTLRKKQKNLR